MKNPLTNLIPATYRKYVYGVLSLAVLAVTVAQIAGLDVSRAADVVTALCAAFGLSLAHGNTPAE